MKPRIKNHFRAHQLSIWLRLIPELHRAGMEDVISRHNLFKNHDDMELYDGPVKFDSLTRLSFLEETFKQRRGNGSSASEYGLLNVNGKHLSINFSLKKKQTEKIEQFIALESYKYIRQSSKQKL